MLNVFGSYIKPALRRNGNEPTRDETIVRFFAILIKSVA